MGLRDFHAHSTYSDGRFLESMVNAAEAAGLDGIGFADHCTVSAHESAVEFAALHGFTLDITYERRRRALERLREDALRERDVSVTVGTDAHRPGEVGERAAFLREFVAERGLDPVAPPALRR